MLGCGVQSDAYLIRNKWLVLDQGFSSQPNI